jgi:hypothetical protein
MTEDIRSQLLQVLTSSAPDANVGTARELLSQELLPRLNNADPTVKLITEYLIRQSQVEDLENERSQDEDSDLGLLETDADTERLQRLSYAMGNSLRRVRAAIEAMHDELQERRERDGALAAALGACEYCWGRDPACQDCGGGGVSGSFVPDRKLFKQLVAPAVSRLSELREVNGQTHTNIDSPMPTSREP